MDRNLAIMVANLGGKQAKAAQLIGVGAVTLNRWIKGRQQPPQHVRVLAIVINHLADSGVDVIEMLEAENIPPPS